jgi:hypothetical protein
MNDISKQFTEAAGIEYGHIYKYVTFSTHHGWEPAEYRCSKCCHVIKDEGNKAVFNPDTNTYSFPHQTECPKDPDFTDARNVLDVCKGWLDYEQFIRERIFKYGWTGRMVIDLITDRTGKLAVLATKWLNERKEK